MQDLFSQLYSLEVLVSPMVESAEAWTLMIWLAIFCKEKNGGKKVTKHQINVLNARNIKLMVIEI